jgi:uncharacterized protein
MASASGCIYHPDRGYAIHTWTAKAFYPQDIRPEDVDIRDIAHSLGMTCRYGGQPDFRYCVGQHSVYCWEMAVRLGYPPHLLREALLHDAVEAYLGADFPRPYKMMIPALVEFEAMIERQLNPILHIPIKKSPEIRFIDETMLATEMPLLFQKHGAYVWINDEYVYTGDESVMEGLPPRLEWDSMPSWSPEEAEERFLEAYESLDQLEMAA